MAQVGASPGYVGELIEAKRAAPGEAPIDDLIAARDRADRLTERELPSLVTRLIAVGNETTSTALSRFLAELPHDERRLWPALLADPELLASALDELLRHTGPSKGLAAPFSRPRALRI